MGGRETVFNERPGLRLFSLSSGSGGEPMGFSAALELCCNSFASFGHKFGVNYALHAES